MLKFDINEEIRFRPEEHTENIIGKLGGGDITVASFGPNQISSYHCHPEVIEIYLCVQGGGRMRAPDGVIDMKPGVVAVNPPGELHEFATGPEPTLLFRIRWGGDPYARYKEWPSNPHWRPSKEDLSYFASLK